MQKEKTLWIEWMNSLFSFTRFTQHFWLALSSSLLTYYLAFVLFLFFSLPNSFDWPPPSLILFLLSFFLSLLFPLIEWVQVLFSQVQVVISSVQWWWWSLTPKTKFNLGHSLVPQKRKTVVQCCTLLNECIWPPPPMIMGHISLSLSHSFIPWGPTIPSLMWSHVVNERKKERTRCPKK